MNAGHEVHWEIAPLAAAAARSLREWDSMDDYNGVMPSNSPDCPFYQAILSVHKNQFTKAANQILKACDLLDPTLMSVVGENPRCTYKYVGHLLFSPLLYVDNICFMVQAQMLPELKEIIACKQFCDR